MKTKYVCRGFISPYVNFYYNRTMWSTNLHVKICRWGERKKSRNTYCWMGKLQYLRGGDRNFGVKKLEICCLEFVNICCPCHSGVILCDLSCSVQGRLPMQRTENYLRWWKVSRGLQTRRQLWPVRKMREQQVQMGRRRWRQQAQWKLIIGVQLWKLHCRK